MEQEDQLLSDYSDQEKGAYLSVIASIATVDRQATDEETEFLEALTQTAHLSPQQEQEVKAAAQDTSNEKLKQHLDALKNSQLRFALIADIISFAKADGQYSAEEQAKIKEISQYLRIEEPQFAAINQVVDKTTQAQAQGQDVSQPGFLNSTGIGDVLSKVGISSNMVKGMLGLAAPLLLGRMLGGKGGVGRAAGVVGGGLIGAILSGGLGGQSQASGGGLGNILGGGNSAGGGIGSIISVLTGGRGYANTGSGGGLGSVLGKILGR